VQQELDTVLGTAQAVCYEDRERLPYARAVLHEVQRLSSVVAVGAVRQCVTSTCVRGYYIPKVGGPEKPKPDPIPAESALTAQHDCFLRFCQPSTSLSVIQLVICLSAYGFGMGQL
jgi:hypothetical protein